MSGMKQCPSGSTGDRWRVQNCQFVGGGCLHLELLRVPVCGQIPFGLRMWLGGRRLQFALCVSNGKKLALETVTAWLPRSDLIAGQLVFMPRTKASAALAGISLVRRR